MKNSVNFSKLILQLMVKFDQKDISNIYLIRN